MAGLLLPTGLAAQATDSLPFRAGQWGAEFTASGGFGGVGLMRFSSARRAWFFNVQAGYSTTGSEVDPGLLTGGQGLDSQAGSVFARFGPRWFRPSGARVIQQLTLGVEVAGSRTNREVAVDSLRALDLTLNNESLGAFGEVGAAWMVTPRLSLGAAYGMSARYVSSEEEDVRFRGDYYVASQRRRGWDAALGQFALRAALYF